MKNVFGRPIASFGLGFLVVFGIVMLALLVLAPDYAQARLDGPQPVPLGSGLMANYARDPRELAVHPVDVKVVEQVIEDRITSTALPPQEQAATSIGMLQTPVFTITPTPLLSPPGVNLPTQAPSRPTATAFLATPTRTLRPTQPPSTGPTASATEVAATQTETPTASPTPEPVITAGPTRTVTRTPKPSQTLAPTPPNATPIPTARPTQTPKPTKTWTATATQGKPTVPPSETPTPSATGVPPTSTFTMTPTRTPTRTATPSRTPTRTFTPTRTPTAHVYPPPPTAGPSPTKAGYP